MTGAIYKSFNAILNVMKIPGLYTPKSHTFLWKVSAYMMYFIFLILSSALVFVNILLSKNLDTATINLMVAYVAETAAFCFKFLPFFHNGQRIRKCIHFFGNKRFEPKNEEEKKIVEECVRICRRNTKIYFYAITITLIIWGLHAMLRKDRRIPLEIWLPYNPASSNLRFYLTFTYAFACMLYSGVAGSITDPLIGGLTYHATCQLKILKYNLQNIDETVEDAPNKLTEISFGQVSKHLRHCINHHNDILNFVTEFEKCFSFPIFCQFAGSLFALCFCVIGLILVPLTSINGVIYMLSFVVISFQIFFYCHYGTLLFEENNTLIDAIYMGPWYRYDTMIRKILLIVMERSKRPMIITAAKVINSTLQTYVSVLKSSYSLTAVMNNYG